tara:strand:+ start:369 stop:1070 length:702 start_codon:yes stop_codon:yes gene_type:complete
MSFLFFIPARGGSKRIKNKNLIKLNNKPLIKYTLDVCKKFKNIDTIVSTENKKIRDYCIKHGVTNVYSRPNNLSKDNTSMIDVILNYIEYLSKKKIIKYKNIVLLQPTSPLRTFEEIKKSMNFFLEKKLSSLASISKMREHPFECVKIKKNKWKYLDQPKKKIFVSQKYSENYYFIDGSIYINSINFLKKYKSLITKNKTKFIKNNNNFAIDIDNPEDLLFAKYKMQENKKYE